MISEPTVERILGYYIIINDLSFPRNLPNAETYIKSNNYKGYSSTLVCRKVNPSFIKPKVNQIIISHKLSEEEQKLYMSMKIIIKSIKKRINESIFILKYSKRKFLERKLKRLRKKIILK